MSKVYDNVNEAIKQVFANLDELTHGTRFYIGISNNPDDRIKNDHWHVYDIVGPHYYTVACQNYNIAKEVEKHFVHKTYNNKPIDGDTGGGNATSTYVYTFSHNGKR